MKGLCVIVAIIVALMSCEDSQTVQLPPDEVLIDLVYDLHLAEMTLNRVHALNQDSVSAELRQRIARSYKISPEEMDEWLDQLQKSPEHLMLVYDSVIARYERAVPAQ